VKLMTFSQDVVLEVRDLKKYFPIRRGFFRSLTRRDEQQYVMAVDGVSFSIRAGETLGLAGESGSGKTTTGKLIVHLLEATSGTIKFQGRESLHLEGGELKRFRRQVQMIFQDPYTSQNSRFTVSKWVEEPLIIHGLGDPQSRKRQVMETLERTGLKPAGHYVHQFPHQLSGGQRQRLANARALVLHPRCLVADEPTSMLDVSLRAGLIKLIQSLTVELGLATLYISHDLSVMRYLCNRIAIMYLGRIVEIGPTEEILKNPLHPYSRALISAVPIPNPYSGRQRTQIPGEPSLRDQAIRGCRFQPRCPVSETRCAEDQPEMAEVEEGRMVACWRA
jgi:peptide/nickel transport system ATP-binding protein